MSSRAAKSSLAVILLDVNHPLRFIFWSAQPGSSASWTGVVEKEAGGEAHNTGRTRPPSPPTSHRIPTTKHLKKQQPDFDLFCQLYRKIGFFVNSIFNHVLHGNMRDIVECANDIFSPVSEVSVDSTCITNGNFPSSSLL